jgi:hypothetical protein
MNSNQEKKQNRKKQKKEMTQEQLEEINELLLRHQRFWRMPRKKH